jgi:hypothetical protein
LRRFLRLCRPDAGSWNVHPLKLLSLSLALFASCPAQATPSAILRAGASELNAVVQARRLLTSGVWSQVIRVTNDRPGKAIAKQAWGLAFELGSRIWVYLPRVGTQSPAVRAGDLEEHRKNLAPVLEGIDSGFGTYEVVEPDRNTLVTVSDSSAELPNACLIESLATLRNMVLSGEDIERADLLMYYANVPSAPPGHTVLIYETDSGRFAWDPVDPDRITKLSARVRDDPLSVARVVADRKVRSKLSDARYFSIDLSDIKSPDRCINSGTALAPQVTQIP